MFTSSCGRFFLKPGGLADNVRRVMRAGETSGSDLLAGVYLVARQYAFHQAPPL